MTGTSSKSTYIPYVSREPEIGDVIRTRVSIAQRLPPYDVPRTCACIETFHRSAVNVEARVLFLDFLIWSTTGAYCADGVFSVGAVGKDYARRWAFAGTGECGEGAEIGAV